MFLTSIVNMHGLLPLKTKKVLQLKLFKKNVEKK